MRVLQINSVNGLKSTGRTTIELANYINDCGNECYIAYSEGLSYRYGYKIGNKLERKIHALMSRLSGKQAYYSSAGTRKLIRYIEKINPDVIHIRNVHANYINILMLLNFIIKKDIPTVLTLHDCWFYTGKCTHYTVDKCYKWLNKCGDCPRLKKDNKSWFFDKTKKMLEDKEYAYSRISRLAVVGVSDWITNEAKKSILKNARIITRIYNWIDLEVFKPHKSITKRKQLNLENKFVILGVASKWNKEKGIDKFINISIKLYNFSFILIGNLENQELPRNVINIPEIHNIDELAVYYSLADVLLNLSAEESFGKVTAEAMACGTPVIVLKSTANPELVGEGCGYAVDDNISTIIEMINKVEENGKSSYSDNCTNYARKNFDINERIDDYLKLYSLIIQKKV